MSYLTTKQLNRRYNHRPAISVYGVALLNDRSGRWLIVKPAYKDGWGLVGGCSERNESPLNAVRREVREEIGVSLIARRFSFAGVRFVAPRAGRTAYVQVYFCATLRDDEIHQIDLQPDEIAEYRFVSVAKLSTYAGHPRMEAAIELITRDRAYLENEVAVLDSTSFVANQDFLTTKSPSLKEETCYNKRYVRAELRRGPPRRPGGRPQ